MFLGMHGQAVTGQTSHTQLSCLGDMAWDVFSKHCALAHVEEVCIGLVLLASHGDMEEMQLHRSEGRAQNAATVTVDLG
eukprot:3097347-Amphidinium_carterae.1